MKLSKIEIGILIVIVLALLVCVFSIRSCSDKIHKAETEYFPCVTEARNAYCLSQGHLRVQIQGWLDEPLYKVFRCVTKDGQLTSEYAKEVVDMKNCHDPFEEEGR